MGFGCFVAHDHQSNNRLVKISEILKDRGIKPFTNQVVGDNEINKPVCVIVFVTQDFQNKVFVNNHQNSNDNCYIEFQNLVKKNLPMILVVLEENMKNPKDWDDGLLLFRLYCVDSIEMMWSDSELNQSVDELISTIRKIKNNERDNNEIKYDGKWKNNKIEYNLGVLKNDRVIYNDENRKYGDRKEYVGERKNKTRDGKGILIYKDGSIYEGEWNNDCWHGKGVFTYKDENRESGDRIKYVGEWKNNTRHGKGVLEYKDGSKYQGEWKDDRWHGKGVFTYKDENRGSGDRIKYVGEWVNNKRHGKGILIYKDGSIYEGEWKDDCWHGKGVFTGSDKNRGSGERKKYVGEWEKNDRHGKGIFHDFEKGHRYEGVWEKNQVKKNEI